MSQPEPPFSSRPDALPSEAINPYHSPHAPLAPGETSYVTRTGEELNPWISIWTKPRATIRQIVDTRPTYMVLPLAMLSGVAQVLDNASSRNLGDRAPLAAVIAAAVIIGPLSGLLTLFLFGALMRWTGSWLGGVATSQQIRAALAWGRLPGVCVLAIWIPLLVLFGNDVFSEDIESRPDPAMALGAIVVLGLAGLVLGIWQAVLVIKCLAEVHQFSAWKGLGTMLLAGLVIFAIIIIPVILLIVVLAGSA